MRRFPQSTVIAGSLAAVLCAVPARSSAEVSRSPLWSTTVEDPTAHRATPHALAAESEVVALAGMLRLDRGDDWGVVAVDGESGAELWRHIDTRGSESYDIVATRDRFHVAGDQCINFTPCDGVVRTYEATTGAILWEDIFDFERLKTGPRVVATDGRRLFVMGTVRGGGKRDAFVRAYDASSGALLWTDLWAVDDRRSLATGPIDATVRNGRLILASNDGRVGTRSSIGFRAYKAGSGESLWTHQRSGFLVDRVASLAVRGSTMIAVGGGSAGLVWALDVETGELVWKKRVNWMRTARWFSDVARRGSTVFAAGESAQREFVVLAYRARDGKLLWESRQPAPRHLRLFHHLAVSRGRLYSLGFAAEGQPGAHHLSIHELERRTGRLKASTSLQTRAISSFGYPKPLLHSNRLILGASSGRSEDYPIERPHLLLWAFGL